MANIYVGFHDQRSSSRVLKPPGGGTSDIFGTDALKVKKGEEKSAPNTPTKDGVDAKQNENEKKSDSNNSVSNGNREGQSISEGPNIANLSIKEENGDQGSESKAESKPDTIGSIIRQDDKVRQQQPQQQSPVAEPEKKTPQRVPPGGFSSGLW